MANPNARNESSEYRERGFVCSACGEQVLVMGGDAPPTACPACEMALPAAPAWDHDVSTRTVVSAHVDPAAV